MSETTQAKEVIRTLVGAWGDAEQIASLVSDDAEWWITPTAGLPSPMVGKAQIAETMRKVFGVIYDPARTRSEVHRIVGEGDRASVRFTMFSHVLLTDRPY